MTVDMTGHAGVRLFHGGAPGLRPGQMLLPPDVTGDQGGREDAALLERMGVDLNMEADRARSDRVYLTWNRELGRAYAAGWTWQPHRPGYGALYVAEPVGPTWPDPDLVEHSIECEKAVIVSVYDPVVTMSYSRWSKIMLSFATIDSPGAGRPA